MSEPAYTILVIDDEPITRITLAALLDNLNCRVETENTAFRDWNSPDRSTRT